jgi:hypothetical protein
MSRRSFNNKLSSAAGMASTVIQVDSEFARVLIEDLWNVQGVDVSLLLDFEIRRADDLGAFPVPCDFWRGFAFDLDTEFDSSTLFDLFGGQALSEFRRQHGGSDNELS